MAIRTSLMEFQIPKIVHEEVDENRGIFVIEPLDRGFGYTFGNSLRRVLLSSLEGAAVTSVKIEGVAHEFTTLQGVREDVTDIILNLKSLICLLHGESPEVEVRLAKGARAPSRPPTSRRRPTSRSSTRSSRSRNLSDKGRLEVTLTIGRGRGYVPAELNRGPEHTIGVIPVDSIFSPCAASRTTSRPPASASAPTTTSSASTSRRTARSTRARRSARPPRSSSASSRSSRTSTRSRASARPPPPTAAAEPSLAHGMENFPIEELELGVRSYNCLKRVGIETIGDLVTKTESELAAIPNFGKKSIEEVKETLPTHGLTLRGDETEASRCATSARQEARPRLGAPQGALREPRRRADRARPDQDDRGEGQGGAAVAEQMITLGRRGDIHARRQALAYLRSQEVVHKLFAEVAPRFADRPGGYTRIVKSARARATPPTMAYLELVDYVPGGAPPVGAETEAPARRGLRRRSAAAS